MPKNIKLISALVVVMLAAAACGGTPSADDAADQEGGASSTVADNAGYLSALRASGNLSISNTGDDVLLTLGNDLCAEAAQPGSSPESVNGAMATLELFGGGDAATSSLIAGSAYGHLCPQYKDLYNSALAAPSGEIATGITAEEFKSIVTPYADLTKMSCFLVSSKLTINVAVESFGGTPEDWQDLITKWEDAHGGCES